MQVVPRPLQRDPARREFAGLWSRLDAHKAMILAAARAAVAEQGGPQGAAKAFFRPRARLLLQLGDELVRNESVAVLELVKNAYDADATRVSLAVNCPGSEGGGTITVEDDGAGMDVETVLGVWMEPGTGYKRERGRRATEKFGRTVLGEKGVGRFAAHKLGDSIELVTRRSGRREVRVVIDWNAFGDAEYLEDVPITVEEREPVEFAGGRTGTRITVRDLRGAWDRRMLRAIYRSYSSLRSPGGRGDAFGTEFSTDREEWLEGMLSEKDVDKLALFRFECEMGGGRITKFDYRFEPWPSMGKIKPRRVTEGGDFGKAMAMVYRDGGPIDLSRHKIGKVRFDGMVFDRDPMVLKLGLQALRKAGERAGLEEYLDRNGGVMVFRDGMRVYDYGEPGSDWLELGARPEGLPGARIGNGMMLASVHLVGEKSADLKEKTNREGFVENEAYRAFAGAVLYALERVEDQRRIDKASMREIYGPTRRSEPVISQIAEAKRAIRGVADEKLRAELSASMDRIERDHAAIHATLLRSAGAGLNLGVAVHEMDKIVDELGGALKNKEGLPDRITSLITLLEKLVKGYELTIMPGPLGAWSARELVEHALFNMEFRLKDRGIEIVFEGRDAVEAAKIRCSRSHAVTSMMLALDNSVWWLCYAGAPDKKIFISTRAEPGGGTALLFADNGPGFSLPTGVITEPGVTSKPGGMGLGLHIAREIMIANGGRLSFPEPGEYAIPEEFRGGAIVAFVFKGGGKSDHA